MKIIKKLWVLLLCMGVGIAMAACESEKTNRSQLVGTWVEQTDLYNVMLTLNEDDTFDFKTNGYAPQLDGTGTYKYAQGGYSYDYKLSKDAINYHLTLTYAMKAEPHTFRVITISSKKLVIDDRTRYKFTLARK